MSRTREAQKSASKLNASSTAVSGAVTLCVQLSTSSVLHSNRGWKLGHSAHALTKYTPATIASPFPSLFEGKIKEWTDLCMFVSENVECSPNWIFSNVYFYFHLFLLQIHNRSTLAMVLLWLMRLRTAEHLCSFGFFLLNCFPFLSVHFVKFHAHEYVIISFNWVDVSSSCSEILGSTWHGAVNSTLIMSTLSICNTMW